MKLKVSDYDDVYYPIVSVVRAKLSEVKDSDEVEIISEKKTEAVVKIDRTDEKDKKELVIETIKTDAEVVDGVEAEAVDEKKVAINADNDEKIIEKEEAVGVAETKKTDDDKVDKAEVKTSDDTEEKEGETPTLINVAAKANEQPKRRRRWDLEKWWGRLSTVIVAVIAIVAAGLVGLRLAGFRTFTVMSGSMEPEYPVGAMIYVQPVDYTELKVGDVISYIANGENTIVTHRIAEIEVDKGDASVLRFKTKGDMNETADARLVHYKNVLGKPAVVIPLVGYVAYNIQQPPGVYVALVAGTLLLAWTFMPGTLEERRKTARKSVSGV